MGHRQGESREQAALFPVTLDEVVGPDSLVRVIGFARIPDSTKSVASRVHVY